MEKLLSHYPWLVDGDTLPAELAFLPQSGGRAKKKPAPHEPGRAQLQGRFPALRGRR